MVVVSVIELEVCGDQGLLVPLLERCLPAGEKLVEAVDQWRSGVYVCLKGEEVISGRSVKGSRRRGRRGRRGGYLSGVITDRVSHSSDLLSSHNQLLFPSEAVPLVS